MRIVERCRRVATVALVGACLAVAPQIALADYSTPKSAVQSVGTASMVAPSGLAGSWLCKTTGQADEFTATITNFTDNGPAGAGYRFQVTNTDGFVSQIFSSSTRSITLPVTQPKSGNTTTWTVHVWAVLSQWSSTKLSVGKSCGRTGGDSGSY